MGYSPEGKSWAIGTRGGEDCFVAEAVEGVVPAFFFLRGLRFFFFFVAPVPSVVAVASSSSPELSESPSASWSCLLPVSSSARVVVPFVTREVFSLGSRIRSWVRAYYLALSRPLWRSLLRLP